MYRNYYAMNACALMGTSGCTLAAFDDIWAILRHAVRFDHRSSALDRDHRTLQKNIMTPHWDAQRLDYCECQQCVFAGALKDAVSCNSTSTHNIII